MKPDEIKLLITACNQTQEDASVKRHDQLKVIEKEYNDTITKSTKVKEDILNTLTKRAWELLKDDAPFDRNGNKVKFDEYGIYNDGIWVRWDADHPNDIVSYNFTFDELYKNGEI